MAQEGRDGRVRSNEDYPSDLEFFPFEAGSFPAEFQLNINLYTTDQYFNFWNDQKDTFFYMDIYYQAKE